MNAEWSAKTIRGKIRFFRLSLIQISKITPTYLTELRQKHEQLRYKCTKAYCHMGCYIYGIKFNYYKVS